MEMYKDTVSGGRTSSLFQEFVGTHFEGKTETVEVTTFEELIHRFGAPDFVKVDVEGAELSIFEKADKLPTQTIYFIEYDRKSLLALRGVGPESEAESVRFHGRRVTRVGPEVKHGRRRAGGR